MAAVDLGIGVQLKEMLVITTTFPTITAVLKVLTERLEGDGQHLGPISTRVALRTGVSLRNIRPDQEKDPVLIQKVLETLSEMGFKF
ncbi:hypothetical protein [Kineosporia sp. NBRC 101731]|uniref:hypothetical protein n=1 Tax=Kineosporia sp. NBRC 101731 TaxID=3032199 RepID=UPI002556882C|nr:hypothetical protein [Kineosporia sp. NBRC 101731]